LLAWYCRGIAGQEDRRTGGQEDRRTGGQEDRRTGGQEDKRTESILPAEMIYSLDPQDSLVEKMTGLGLSGPGEGNLRIALRSGLSCPEGVNVERFHYWV